jgi:hypothetical protein
VKDTEASRFFVGLKRLVEAKVAGMCEGMDREEKGDVGLRIGKREKGGMERKGAR